MKNLLPIICLLIFTSQIFAQGEPQLRNEKWAKPIKSDKVTNLFKLDDMVFRSEQPDKEGFAELGKMGIKTILSLREYHSDEGKVKGTNLKFYRIKMDAGKIKDDEVIAALNCIKKAPKPVLVHCWHGSDRTGLVCAMYRIVFQDWTKKDAIDELINGGYGYHDVYSNIPKYIENVDIKLIKSKLGK